MAQYIVEIKHSSFFNSLFCGNGMYGIKVHEAAINYRALISGFDKTNVLKLAEFLNSKGVEIISTGGTYKYLKENNIPLFYKWDKFSHLTIYLTHFQYYKHFFMFLTSDFNGFKI
jgi:hypothetical protein